MESKGAYMRRMLAQPTIRRVNLGGGTAPAPSGGGAGGALPSTTKNPTSVSSSPPSAPPSPMPAATVPLPSLGGTASLTRQVFDIITVLKAQEGAVHRNEIYRKTLIDVYANKELLDFLAKNDKVLHDPERQTFQFKPTYNIRNKEELSTFLRANQIMGGVEVKELKESFADVVPAINELEQEGRVFVVRNLRDGAPRIIYHNSVEHNLPISPDYKELWAAVKVPETREDLEAELLKCGLKGLQVVGSRIQARDEEEGGGKKKARRNKRMRLTNTHLEGIDLTKDFVLGDAPR